jgi:TolB-like protein
VDVRQVSRELGVRYVLEGSIRKAGSRIRIVGQLIDATTGHHLHAHAAETYKPWRDKEFGERYIEALRIAGVPE